jgi:NAD kinase
VDRLTETKIVLVVRETRLEELKARFNTVSQARFYVEQLGADFADYEREDATYRKAVTLARESLAALGRLQVVPRGFLPNFIFGPDDVVVAVGQDGLVANTLKYLDGQPLVGVNPDPTRHDGKLLPFRTPDLVLVMPEVLARRRSVRQVTMARVALNNGQTLHAVNDLFIGPKSHGSARYTLRHGERVEAQSSSGVIVSTGLGSTGWFSSLLAGARGLMAGTGQATPDDGAERIKKMDWDADHLVFTVREPFPSKTTSARLVFGEVDGARPLILESLMPERGVIFSDGFEQDFLEFNSGARAEIAPAERRGRLVV